MVEYKSKTKGRTLTNHNTNQNMKPIEIIISIVVIAGLVCLFIAGINKYEEERCMELQSQAQEFQAYDTERDTGFYITKSEKEMCDHAGIEIIAHVK